MTAIAHNGGDEVRRKRAQLAKLLGGIDDLETDWVSTAELARYLCRQREHAGWAADTAAVIADLEAVMRGSMPLLPDYKPKQTALDQLLPAIDNAQKKYDDLIHQHVAWAATALDQDRSEPC
jgi:hypothetical protein